MAAFSVGDSVVLTRNVGEIEPCGARNVEGWEGETGVITDIYNERGSLRYVLRFKSGNSYAVWRSAFAPAPKGK